MSQIVTIITFILCMTSTNAAIAPNNANPIYTNPSLSSRSSQGFTINEVHTVDHKAIHLPHKGHPSHPKSGGGHGGSQIAGDVLGGATDGILSGAIPTLLNKTHS